MQLVHPLITLFLLILHFFSFFLFSQETHTIQAGVLAEEKTPSAANGKCLAYIWYWLGDDLTDYDEGLRRRSCQDNDVRLYVLI